MTQPIQSIRQQLIEVSPDVSRSVRPSTASDMDVMRVLAKLGVRADARQFEFFRSEEPALSALGARAARVADNRAVSNGYSPAGVERSVSYLVAEGDRRVLGVAVSYAFRGPFSYQTTIVVDPQSMRTAYM